MKVVSHRHANQLVRQLGDATPTYSLERVKAATGKSMTELNADLRRALDEQPMVSLCGVCDWSFEGPAGVARELAAEHRLDAHPELKRKRRDRLPNLTEQSKRAQARTRAHNLRAPASAKRGVHPKPGDVCGTITGYFSRGCRCERCRQAARDYKRKYRESRT